MPQCYDVADTGSAQVDIVVDGCIEVELGSSDEL
jgi:hypothetical protein